MCADDKLEKLKHNLRQLALEYPRLRLPCNVRREELLVLVEEEPPLKNQLQRTLDLLMEEFPQIPIGYEIPGYGLGFITEVKILNWLHFLLVSPASKLTVDGVLGRLTDLYSSTSIEADVYAFFSGLNGLEFGDHVAFGDFVIGRVVENGLVDGRWMQYKCTAMDFFIKTRASLPVTFGPNVGFDFQPHLVQSLIMNPLSGELQLLEADRRSAVRPFAYHLRFDPLKVPLARLFDNMIELGNVGYWGRRRGAAVTGEAIGRLWDKYARLSGPGKDQLKISLRWISKSLHMDESIDAMIAVGTALEVLFLDRDLQDQLSYRISLNGSLWLEDNPANRLIIQKEIKAAYNARSKSVHGVAHNVDISAVNKGRDLAVRAVLLALERGGIPANWNGWILERFPASAP
jgi:Apea-like HEPN